MEDKEISREFLLLLCQMGIVRFQEAKSGNFRADADSERKASRETFGRATDESGDMAPDEDREAVEISRGSRNREISGGIVGKLSGGR